MAGTKITLEQMIEKCKDFVPWKFSHDLLEFTTLAGQYSKNVFQKSFDNQSFNGSKWKPRESRWGKKFTHPILYDTGILQGSIRYVPQKPPLTNYEVESYVHELGKSKRRTNGTHTYKQYVAEYYIKTNENSQAIHGKRGVNRKAVGYAAIHNTDPRVSPYTVNQHSTRKPVQRQFIGFSQEIDDYINNDLIKNVLFKRFPT